MASALRRFGILECIPCGVPHEFVSYDPHITHITDAFCCDCGWIPGRRNDVDLGTPPITGDRAGRPMIRIERRKLPVISDDEARAALARLRARHPGAPDAEAAAALRPPSGAPAAAVAPDPASGADSLRSPPPDPVPAGASLRSPPAGTPAATGSHSVRPLAAGPQVKDSEDALAEMLEVEDDGSRRAAFLRTFARDGRA